LLNALPIFPIEQPEVPEVKKRPATLTAGRRKSIRAKGRGPTGK
jgi:ATP-dependent DNA helicase DinG